MTTVLTRARALFLTPTPAAPAAAPSSNGAVLLGANEKSAPVAAALAARLAADAGTDAALVCEWRPATTAPVASRIAAGGARRLASRLAVRGHETAAAGRLVRVRLPEDPPRAAAEAARVSAASPVPPVLALLGPRDASFDALLAGQDFVVAHLPDASDALVALVVAGLAHLPGTVAVVRARCTGARRHVAALGLLPLPREALSPAAVPEGP